MKKRMLSLLLNLVFAAVSLWIGIAVAAWLLADRMMFPQVPPSYTDGDSVLRLPMEDGSTIAALYLPNGKARYTLLFAHGNAEDIGTASPFLQLMNQQGFEILAVEYPGYGTSEGRATESSVNAAMQAAYDFLVNDLKTPPEHILVYGRSIGTGPAVDIAANNPVGGLILESGFVSAYRIMTHWPIFPGDRFPNLRKIDQIECPLLLIHGTEDEIIGFWHSEKLYKSAKQPKTYLWVDGANHNNLIHYAGETYWDSIISFRNSIDSSSI